MELYIVRHGETKWNSLGLLQGNTDIELDEKGTCPLFHLSMRLVGRSPEVCICGLLR